MVQFGKSSVRNTRKNLVKAFPDIEPVIDQLIPKKSVVYTMRLKENDKSELVIVEDQIICFLNRKR